jgi:hypothetical protein
VEDEVRLHVVSMTSWGHKGLARAQWGPKW